MTFVYSQFNVFELSGPSNGDSGGLGDESHPAAEECEGVYCQWYAK